MRWPPMPMLVLAVACSDGGTPEPPPVQKNPDIGESRHDTSPPLKDLPPAPRLPGQRVHPVKPLPRPKPPDAGEGSP